VVRIRVSVVRVRLSKVRDNVRVEFSAGLRLGSVGLQLGLGFRFFSLISLISDYH